MTTEDKSNCGAFNEAVLEFNAGADFMAGHDVGFRIGLEIGHRTGLEAASEHLLRLAERTDAGTTQGIGVALVRAAREVLELGKGEL